MRKRSAWCAFVLLCTAMAGSVGAMAQNTDGERARATSLTAAGTTLAAKKTPDAYQQAAASFEEAAELWGRATGTSNSRSTPSTVRLGLTFPCMNWRKWPGIWIRYRPSSGQTPIHGQAPIC